MSERLAAPRAATAPLTTRWLALAAVLTVALAAFLAATGGLRFAPVKDERHFIETSRALAAELPPSLEALRSYEEVITPAAFLFWGALDRLTGDGLVAGRLANLLLVAGIVCGVALRRGRPSEQRVRATLGLLAFPYLLGLGVHLYTDVPATFLAFFGARAHLRGRFAIGAILLALAVATRQYLVAVPVALLAWEWSRAARGEAGRWRAGVAPGLAAATLLGWFAFFGGLAPEPGLERWLPRYPAPMAEARTFIVAYGLYFLAAVGAYFVVPEALLFRRRVEVRALWTLRNAAIAVLLAALFVAFPPAFDLWNGGMLDVLGQIFFPPGPGTGMRMVVYWLLALLACVRFGQRLDLAFWLVAVHFVLLMKAQLPWDKYYMPVVVLLWFLVAEGRLDDRLFSPAASGAAPRRADAAAGG